MSVPNPNALPLNVWRAPTPETLVLKIQLWVLEGILTSWWTSRRQHLVIRIPVVSQDIVVSLTCLVCKSDIWFLVEKLRSDSAYPKTLNQGGLLVVFTRSIGWRVSWTARILTLPMGTAPRRYNSLTSSLSIVCSLPVPFWPSNVPIHPI